MTRPTRPDVSDPDLRAALEQVGPHIENYLENLDLISKDIKAVEKYLTDSGVRLFAEIDIGYTETLTDGGSDVTAYSGGITRDVESIKWAPVDEHGDEHGRDRWRLQYVVSRRRGEVVEGVTAPSYAPIDISGRIAVFGPTFKCGSEGIEQKPLIEASLAVRLKAHKSLARLVSRLGALVEEQSIVAAISSSEQT